MHQKKTMLKFGHKPTSKTKLAVKTKINAKDKTKALSETGRNLRLSAIQS